VVGHLAKRQMITNAANTIHTVKRLIGRGWASPQVKRMRETVAYQLVEGPHGDVRVGLRGEVYSVPEISANETLEEKKQQAETLLLELDRIVAARRSEISFDEREQVRAVSALALEAIDRQDPADVTEQCATLERALARLKSAPAAR
jgi:molecular chaperone DnaK (HSP70)